MPLSLHKLEMMVSKYNMLMRKIYTIDNYCVYLELLCINTGDVCMLYIPSKYEIKGRGADNEYKISYIDISEDGNIPEDYAGNPDNFDLENTYNEIDIGLETSHKNMEGHLEESYNHPVSLKDMSKNDKKNLREIFRQLRRLRLCVQNLKYKLCITYKGYLCCIRRDDTFECFHITSLGNMDDTRTLVVTFDIETFYRKAEVLTEDIKTVRNGIYNILDKNQIKHTGNLHKILQYKTSLMSVSESCLNKKRQYTEGIIKLDKMLVELGITRELILTKLAEIDKRYRDNRGLKGIHRDIEKSHLTTKHETELSNVNAVKQEIISNIMELKLKRETLSLKLDKIFFDNTVMLDAILKNFELLTEL
jgi:hypothetical protein